MAVLSASEHAGLLKRAELQFRLMVAVRTACSLGNQPLTVPVTFTFGKKTVKGSELRLSNDEADEAAAVLEHTVTYTLALQIVQAMKDVLGKPREHTDTGVQAAFEIARLVRNSYAHQPFRPHWSIDPDCLNKTFDVPGIARLDTAKLPSQRVHWQDYGGMLAMYRLSQYVRSVILPSEAVSVEEDDTEQPPLKPGDITQFGRLLLVTLDKMPESAKRIPHDGPFEIHAPDGTYTIASRPS